MPVTDINPRVAEFSEYRRAIRELCAGFESTYWRSLDERAAYPDAFVRALTDAGWLAALIPEEWLAASAHGRSEDAARTIVRELELGCHSVILHGAEPHEIGPMVAAYREIRKPLARPVATNPGLFATSG